MSDNRKSSSSFDILALLASMILALAFRLPGLTVFLTADEPRSWLGRSIIFLDSLLRYDLANTGPGGEVSFIENVSLSPAPGVTTMWSGTLGILLEYWRQGSPGSLKQFLIDLPFDPLNPEMLFSFRLPGVLIAMLAVGLTYWWSRPLLGRWGAFLTAILFALNPFYLALSRILGHDALVTTFMWLSLLTLLRAMHDRSRFFIIASGSWAGLAFLSKYPALFLGAFSAGTIFIHYLYGEGWTLSKFKSIFRAWFWDMVFWTVSAAIIFFLLWPAMWINPIEPITTILNDALRASGSPHQKGSFFLGEAVADPGLSFYLLVTLFRITPVLLLGLLLVLISPWLKRRSAPTPTASLLLTLTFYVIFYGLLVTYGGKKQDRYILPAFPALAMLAAAGYTYILDQKSQAKWNPAPILGSLLIIMQIILIYPTYPYYFSYYNPLIGGGQAAAQTIQVGWGEGLDEAAAYLNRLPDAESIEVVSWYSTTFEPYFKGEAIYKIDDEKISRSAKPGLAADYVILYVNQTQRQIPTTGTLQYIQSVTPVYTVTLQGLDYAWIYPSINVQHVINGEARLVGQGELLGLNLTNEAGQPVTSTYPESVLFLSLYWEWLGKIPEEPIQISLINEANETQGWGNHIETIAPLPHIEWEEGMVVEDKFALVIFPDTLPGSYRLSAWIDRPATGETVGVFPFAEPIFIDIIPRPESSQVEN